MCGLLITYFPLLLLIASSAQPPLLPFAFIKTDLKSRLSESSSKKSRSNDSFSCSGVEALPLLGLFEFPDDESAAALRPFFTV